MAAGMRGTKIGSENGFRVAAFPMPINLASFFTPLALGFEDVKKTLPDDVLCTATTRGVLGEAPNRLFEERPATSLLSLALL
ncbi:unnamed protein product [Allacma fusca]|uniref:Uncharacterized protein n=1 Tax=Allacma fusca TaxID=39272 RepID=A0A8J2NL83_9HEXA|nr:unnamed protein product [Allacma fusca]